MQDLKDPIELLSQKNINKPKLLEYIKDTCDYCTDYQLPDLDFALNHHGEPDVALFDFTSMFAAGNSCYVKEKYGKQLLVGLVGDGLLEPFWPTGSGKIFVKITTYVFIIFQICFSKIKDDCGTFLKSVNYQKYLLLQLVTQEPKFYLLFFH